MENKIHVPNHQPERISVRIWVWQMGGWFLSPTQRPNGIIGAYGDQGRQFSGGFKGFWHAI
jgi:hypothetical protein